jgi:hypothetical protein
MSDRDIRRYENMLDEAVAALRRGDIATYAMRDREFYETIAQQSGNAALIDALARCALQIQLCGTITSVSREFAERTAHGYDDIIQAFKARDTPRAAFLVRGLVGHAQEAVLSGFPKETMDQLRESSAAYSRRRIGAAVRVRARPEERTHYSRRLLSANGCDFKSATTAANPGLMAKLAWSKSTGVTLPESGGEGSCGPIRPSKPRE